MWHAFMTHHELSSMGHIISILYGSIEKRRVSRKAPHVLSSSDFWWLAGGGHSARSRPSILNMQEFTEKVAHRTSAGLFETVTGRS